MIDTPSIKQSITPCECEVCIEYNCPCHKKIDKKLDCLNKFVCKCKCPYCGEES